MGKKETTTANFNTLLAKSESTFKTMGKAFQIAKTVTDAIAPFNTFLHKTHHIKFGCGCVNVPCCVRYNRRRRYWGSVSSGRRRRCACVLDTSINIAAVIRTIGSLINKVLNFLSSPFKPIINAVGKVIDNIMNKAINALERKFNQHFNLDKLLVFPVIIKGLKKKAEDQIQSIKDALPMQQMKALFEDSTKKSIPSRYLTTAAKNAAKNGVKQSTPTNNQVRRRS